MEYSGKYSTHCQVVLSEHSHDISPEQTYMYVQNGLFEVRQDDAEFLNGVELFMQTVDNQWLQMGASHHNFYSEALNGKSLVFRAIKIEKSLEEDAGFEVTDISLINFSVSG